MNRSGCIAASIVGLFAAFVIGVWTCTERVEQDKIGVRTNLTGGGVEARDFPAGFVLRIPGIHTVKEWDPTWTNLATTLKVRSSDQYITTVDISIVFRIQPGQCHVVAREYRDDNHIEEVVRNSLNKYANEILAQMKTEDFYDSKNRTGKSSEAQAAMDKQLRPKGIEVRYLLLRNIIFDPKFEALLLKKQLAGQNESLEKAKASLAEAQTKTELITRSAEAEVKRINETQLQEIANLKADTDRAVAKATQDAKQKAALIEAKALSIRRQKMAQAEAVKAKATAAGIAALSKVYSKPGAAAYFSKKALEGIKLGDIEVNSSVFNPLDSAKLLQSLGLETKKPTEVTKP